MAAYTYSYYTAAAIALGCMFLLYTLDNNNSMLKLYPWDLCYH